MNWYYVEAGQQAGPVDDAALGQLVAAGKILPDTLVWKEGMANWLPYSQVMPVGAAPAGGPVPPMPVASGVEEAVCAECGRIFPANDTIRIGEARVCATCKPIFVQKMREGVNVAVAGSFKYAGFWIRFVAVFVDGLILKAVNIVLLLAFGVGFAQSVTGARNSSELGAAYFILLGLQMFMAVAYETFFIGKYGATLGKMACKIRVVVADGTNVSYALSLGRYFAKLVSSFICLIGYIMAGFDDEKRALHDRMCNTRVVYK